MIYQIIFYFCFSSSLSHGLLKSFWESYKFTYYNSSYLLLNVLSLFNLVSQKNSYQPPPHCWDRESLCNDRETMKGNKEDENNIVQKILSFISKIINWPDQDYTAEMERTKAWMQAFHSRSNFSKPSDYLEVSFKLRMLGSSSEFLLQ